MGRTQSVLQRAAAQRWPDAEPSLTLVHAAFDQAPDGFNRNWALATLLLAIEHPAERFGLLGELLEQLEEKQRVKEATRKGRKPLAEPFAIMHLRQLRQGLAERLDRDKQDRPVVRCSLELWSLRHQGVGDFIPPDLEGRALSGLVYGHPGFADGTRIIAGTIEGISGRVVWSAHTTYQLGEPEPSYFVWLIENGRTYDDKKPIRFVK